jgi:hypothetical protein
VLEKAKEYQKKKNLEIPPYFKDNSFAVLNPEVLGDISDDIPIAIGESEKEKTDIVQLLIDKELVLDHDFALQNPEVVLPMQDEICDVVSSLNECKGNDGQEGFLASDQLLDPEPGSTAYSWTIVRSKKNK